MIQLNSSNSLIAATLLVPVLLLLGCSKPEPSGPAQAAFDAMERACNKFLAARTPQVRLGNGDEWIKTGFSPALVQPEVKRTESPITPYVGKLVIKENVAQASAATEAAAQAIALTPAYLLSNRTHTFVFSHDGTKWHWQNGQRLTKIPGQNDNNEIVTQEEAAAEGPNGYRDCLPH